MGSRRSDAPSVAVVAELKRHGIEAEVEISKHHKVRFCIGSSNLMYVTPGTTRDRHRAAKNCLAGIRRLLRENGVELLD